MKTETKLNISQDIMVDALTKFLTSQDIFKHAIKDKYIIEIDTYDYDNDGKSTFVVYMKEDDGQMELPFNES